MTLDEYRATGDANAFWRLSSGEHQNLLDEAIDRMSDAHLRLAAVLCDPEGNVCINGSAEDRRIIGDALRLLLSNKREAGG